ncbi:MAG: hypothetical protein KGL35_12400, partial [Bradyrhizobium sp.]|nr:hypothetical protein [Bradyrhizobium sp.]
LTLEGQWLTAVTDPRWDIKTAGPVRVGDKIDVKPAHRILVWDLVCTDVAKPDIAELLGISEECLETHFAFELKHAYNLMKVKTLRSVRRSADLGNMSAASLILKDHNKSNWRSPGKTPQENENDVESANEFGKEFIREIRECLFEAASMTNSQRQSARKKAA